MKNTLHYDKRHLSGWNDVEQWKYQVRSLAVICYSKSISQSLSYSVSQSVENSVEYFLNSTAKIFMEALWVDLKAYMAIVLK